MNSIGSTNSEGNYQGRHTISLERFIYTLKEFIRGDFMYGRKDTQYKVTENFKKNGENTYSLYNLEAEQEEIFGGQVLVTCCDLKNELKKDHKRVLNNFLKCNILTIVEDWDKHWEACIVFEDGSIKIERQ